MRASSRILLLPLALLVAALCQCATAPAPLPEYPLQPGDEVAVVYRTSGAVLALQNASSRSASTPPAEGAAAKIAADEHVQALLGRLDELGFFDAATATANPQAKASLELAINGRRHVCSQLPLAMSSVEEVEQFQRYAIAFRTLYDNTQAYQAARVDRHDLQRENERLRKNALEATSSRGDR